MSDPDQAHGLNPDDPKSVGSNDLVFDCPSCRKSLVVDRVAAGHSLNCPMCDHAIKVPEQHHVVTLSEAPETKALQSKPEWEQELLGIESALRETHHQRQEAGNAYKHHLSEANRLQIRIEKLDVRLHELEARKSTIKIQHPE